MEPPYYDDELSQELSQAVMPLLADVGTHLYGRRSYEMFRAVFTGPAAPPHAALMTATPKVVVSAALHDPGCLHDPGWGPTTLISGDVAAEGDSEPVSLTLLDSRRHRNGVAALRYAPG